MNTADDAVAAAERLDAIFFALADPTRRAIVARLAHGEATVTELAAPFAMSQPAVSKHLKVLERAGLVTVGLDGTRRPRRLEPLPLAAATEWIEGYRAAWEANFQRLDALPDEMQDGTRPAPQSERIPSTDRSPP
jgi:DNA-binding transcriptional ArsR family regulator